MRAFITWPIAAVLAVLACNPAIPTAEDSGPPECTVAGAIYGAGAVNPADPCQICNPSLANNGWSSQPDLSDCHASGTGTFCQLGKCVNACGIGGLVVLAGTLNPADSCEVCVPASALETWSAVPDCNPDGGLTNPDGGPDAGDAGPPSCVVGGVTYFQGDAIGPCQLCEPDASTTTGQPLADGTLCDAGGNVCVGGTCSPGCWIGEALVTAHSFQSSTQDTCCNPEVSATDWSPGFTALPVFGGTNLSAIAAAAVTTSQAQILVGTAAGAVTLYSELAGSGGSFGPHIVMSAASSGGEPVKAVAAADVSGDGLVDVLYETATSPTLVLQTTGQGFGTPASWPAIPDGGGLWAIETGFGAQVLSFDLAYSAQRLSAASSYLQPQSYSGGSFDDGCQVTVGECAPQQLAFGHIRFDAGTEVVLTCDSPENGPVTFYGTFTDGICGGGPGWQLDQFNHGDFSTGAIIGDVVAVGDLNGDGLSEVVGGGANEVDLQMNWGPTFGTFFGGRTSVPLVAGANVTALAIANLRADAGGNILALDTANGQLAVYYPPAPYDAGVPLTAQYPVPAGASGMAVGDFDGDGRLDVAVETTSGVQVLHRQCP